MNGVIYARYSSHNQQETSIEGQIKECRRYAKQHNINIIKEYADRAMTGTNDKRPEFQQMIEDSSKKQFQVVLIYQYDRFSRNNQDSYVYMGLLAKNGVEVKSIRENVTDDASGFLMKSIFVGMAAYFSKELSQKVKRGLDVCAESYRYLGGTIPLGLKVTDDKMYEIDISTSFIVENIFKMYSEDKTMAEIIRYLNSLGLKTSQGNDFNKGSIRRILTNKKYIGIYTYKNNETKNALPRIISDELFNKVQIMLEKNKKAPSRSKGEDSYLLTSKLYCGYCKSGMHGFSGTSKTGALHRYYQCFNAKLKKCNKKNEKKEFIENLVINETKKLLTTETINIISNEVFKIFQKEKNNNNKINYIKKEIKTVDKSISNLLMAIEKGQNVDIILNQLTTRQEQKKKLEQELALEEMKNPEITVKHIRFFLSQLKKGNINDIAYRKALIDTLVYKVYLYDDHLTIIYTTNTDSDVECSYNEHMAGNK